MAMAESRGGEKGAGGGGDERTGEEWRPLYGRGPGHRVDRWALAWPVPTAPLLLEMEFRAAMHRGDGQGICCRFTSGV
jgi:hypothetical protein